MGQGLRDSIRNTGEKILLGYDSYKKSFFCVVSLLIGSLNSPYELKLYTTAFYIDLDHQKPYL